MTRLFFNEYFERKEERLVERQDENLFTLEKTDVNNFEFISASEHLEIIKKRDELLEKAKIEMLSWCDRNECDADDIHEWLKQYEEMKR